MDTGFDDAFAFNTEENNIFSLFPPKPSDSFLLDSSAEKESSSNDSSPYNPQFPREDDRPFAFSSNGIYDNVVLEDLLHPVTTDFTVDLTGNPLGLSSFFNEQVMLGSDNGSSDSRVHVEESGQSQQTDTEEIKNTPERSTEESQRKKRGRPKKSDDQKKPKKRGRPRKVKEESDEETISDEPTKVNDDEVEKKPFFGEHIDVPPVGEAFAFKKKELLELTSQVNIPLIHQKNTILELFSSNSYQFRFREHF